MMVKCQMSEFGYERRSRKVLRRWLETDSDGNVWWKLVSQVDTTKDRKCICLLTVANSKLTNIMSSNAVRAHPCNVKLS